MRIEFGTNQTSNTTRGAAVMLRKLKDESGYPLYDDTFEAWALKEWSIKFLHESTMYPDHLTGLEMPDEIYTALILKYSL